MSEPDIVQRLRRMSDLSTTGNDLCDIGRAADEIATLRAREAELEAREAILEGVLRSVQDCVVKGDGLPHALRLITEALVNRRAQG